MNKKNFNLELDSSNIEKQTDEQLADLSQTENNSKTEDEKLNDELKKIESIEASSGRKMEESFVEKNKKFIDKLDKTRRSKDKEAKGALLSSEEKALIREEALVREEALRNKKIENISTDNEKNDEEKLPEEKRIDSIDEEKIELERLQIEAEKNFEDYLKAEEKLGEIKKNRTVFNKMGAFFGKGKNEKGHINQEFLEYEKKTNEFKKNYENSYQKLANELVGVRKRELGETLNEEERKRSIKKFVLTEEVIKKIEKDSEEKETERRVTLLGYINENEKKVLEKRKEILGEKKKGNLKKIWDWYGSKSKKEKLLYSVGISATLGAGVVAGGGAGLGVALGYGAWKGGKTLLRRLTLGAATGAALVGMKKGMDKLSDKKKIKDDVKKEEEIFNILDKKEGDIFECLKKYNRKEKLVNSGKKIALTTTAVGILGATLGLDALNNLDELEEVDLEQEKFVVEKEIPPRNFTKESFYKNEVSVDEKEIAKNKEIANKVNENKHYEANSKIEVEKNQAIHKGIKEENLKDLPNQSQELLNQNFELIKGENVWNNLNEHFNGDRQEVAKVLAGFRAETMKDLMESQEMSSVEANKFIEWRYRHMDIGAEFELKNGKLKISDFNNEQKISQFKGTDFNNQNNINDVVKNDGENRVEKFNEVINKRKTVEVPEPQETVEILDPKISDQVDKITNEKINNIYKHWGGGDQVEEWSVMKNKPARDILNQDYGESIGNQLDLAEINNRKELRGYLIGLMSEIEDSPKEGETVEQFIRRMETEKLGVGKDGFNQQEVDIPEPNSEVEVLESNSTENISNTEAFQQYQNQLESDLNKYFSNWEGLKNNNTWDELSKGNPEMKAYLRDLIEKSKMVPSSNEGLNDFVKSAESKVAGYEIPLSSPTEVDQALMKIFNFDNERDLEQWLKIRENETQVIMAGSFDSDVSSEDIEHWNSMSGYLKQLATDSGLTPDSGEKIEQYIKRASSK